MNKFNYIKLEIKREHLSVYKPGQQFLPKLITMLDVNHASCALFCCNASWELELESFLSQLCFDLSQEPLKLCKTMQLNLCKKTSGKMTSFNSRR